MQRRPLRLELARKTLPIAIALGLPALAGAQTFGSGDLIVSGSFYQNVGQVAQLSAGSLLAPASAGGANTVAVGNGQFQNVFLNDGPDANFGVTSQIFLQDYSVGSSSANLNAQYNINAGAAVTSFSSKSELGLNISSDGTALTFMGYTPTQSFSSTGTRGVAAVTTGGSNNLGLLDISNSNTPGVVDTTNPVNGQAYRTVVQVNLNSLTATSTGTAGVYDLTGGVQTTQTNAYSGNNGRAAVLINGSYYMVGNAGNGAKTSPMLTQLAQTTGLQTITAGATNPNTTAVGACTGTAGSQSGYQCGFSYSPSDKTGKDDNFRGLNVYNGQMVVTKGSGSNGLNAVYQVSGYTSPSTATIAVAPGVPSTAGSSTSIGYQGAPFGVWQANATTMYVAYEGDGKAASATTGVSMGTTGSMGGLAKYSLVNGSWTLDYMTQAGLNTSFSSTAVGGGDGMVYTDGLRNITGQVSADGTVTIYGVTSTVTNGSVTSGWDQGANPDQIVSLTDTLAGTSAPTNGFTVLQTSAGGEVFRGVAVAPSAVAVPEPETYALMLAGLGVMGFMVRRKQKRAAR